MFTVDAELPQAPPAEGRYFAPEPGEAEYRAGMAVRHPKYGVGTVVRVDGHGQRAKVTVRFAEGGTRKFIAAMAGEAWRHHVKARGSSARQEELDDLKRKIDELNADLRERVETLERIVTDERSTLKRQFDNLN